MKNNTTSDKNTIMYLNKLRDDFLFDTRTVLLPRTASRLAQLDLMPFVALFSNVKTKPAEIFEKIIQAANIADYAITENKIADGSITSIKLTNDIILNNHLTGSCVSSDNIADYAITENKIADGSITENKLSSNNDYGGVPAGVICGFGGNSPPHGYLTCDGTYLSKEIYSKLYSAIGIVWGEADRTFAVPDLRDEFIRFASDSRAVGTFQDECVGSKGMEAFTEIRTPYAWGYKHMNVLAPKRNVHPSYSDNANNDYRRNLKPSKIGETRPRNATLLACIKY